MNVTGWGRTMETMKSDIKQKLGIVGVDQSKCQESYSTRSSKRKLISSQICAGGEAGKDSCNGDR